MRQIITLIIVLLQYMVMQAVMPGAPAAPVAEQPDTIVIIQGETVPAPDDIYGDESVVIERLAGDSTTVLTTSDYAAIASCGSVGDQLKRLGDTSHNVKPGEFIIPAGIITVAALFAKVPVLRTWREVMHNTISHHGKDKTPVDNWLQYSPMVASYVMQFAGYKGQHDLLDRTILLAMSYATFGVANIALKSTVREKRPDSNARNSFPSGHTGTTFMGAEYLRREYWDKNKWVAMSGYLVGLGVAYMRIHNDRHWVNDVVGGAALGYLSTTFAYWLYPKIFRKRTRMHRDVLLQRIAPETAQTSHQIRWMASPFASAGGYGVSAHITF